MPEWTAETILDLARGYMRPCLLAGAVRLDVFTHVGRDGQAAEDVARAVGTDTHAMTVLLDGLAAIGLLSKADDRYRVPEDVHGLLSRESESSVYHAAHHIANLAPRWADLAEVVRTGVPFTHRPGYEAPPGALESFIEAMHVFSLPQARTLVAKLDVAGSRRLLDVGGGPGTWTMAFLEAHPDMTAVLFDRPEVIPIARRHMEEARLADRVTFVGGSFYDDELPAGCDVAWVSAVIHMNSRQQNRELFAKTNRALDEGGRVLIRDHVMDPTRTEPEDGALFAIAMLLSTTGGGTFTFDELSEDLQAVGFSGVELLGSNAGMSCIVQARKA